MATYFISNKNLNAFKALNLKDISLIKQDSISLIDLQNLGDIIYIDKDLPSDIKLHILKVANLFSKCVCFSKGDKKINVYSEILFENNSKYTTTTNGSQGEDVIKHSALQVEKVARIAYEKTKSFLLNVDFANMLISSEIWRKVVTNINEDYGNVELMNLLVQDFNIYFNERQSKIETILAETYAFNIVASALLQNGYIIESIKYENDSTQKGYTYQIK